MAVSHPTKRRGEAREGKGEIRLFAPILVIAVLIATPAAQAAPDHHKPLLAKEQKAKSRANFCPDHRRALAHYRIKHSHWLALRGVGKRLTADELRQPHGCAYTRYLALKWKVRAAKAKRAYDRWVAHFVINEQPTWIRAMREVQKAYPGTESWLRSCSSTEGAGRNLSINYFQMNHQGSGAGGWLQFMESTFWRMFTAAKEDVESRGFIIPASAASWSSRIGQALAGGWAATHGATGEWSGSGC